MELKQGYKNTDVGLIPEDWQVKSILDVSKHIFLGLTAKVDYVDIRGFPLIRATDIAKGKLDFTDVKTISEEQHKKITRYKISKRGDILVSKSGSLGVCAIVDSDIKFTTYESLITISPKEKLYSNYLLWLMRDENTQERMIGGKVGSSVSHLNIKMFRELKVPLPPLPEQKAIAQALSDTDNLIQAIEKKLNKKRAIKQGAMQQLLTPKEDWEVKKLGEIGKTFGGLSGKSKSDFSNGNSKYIPFMNVMSNPVIDIKFLDSVFIKKNEVQNKAQIGDLFFNGSSETPEEVGLCSVLQENIPNLYLNSFCFGFRLFNLKEIKGLYLSYFFRSDEGRKLFYSLAQGATRYNLSKANFLKLEFAIPNPEEQTEIATILSDMDAEIAQIEQKLSKYKLLKQGLMQQLLTGKIRLV